MNERTQHFFDLLIAMTAKELRARYKHTVFGFFWLVANPLLQMMIIGFVFQFIMKEPTQNYNLYLFIGLLVWNFFSLSLTKATPSIVYERSLIKKSVFPRAVIPLSIILSNFIHFILAVLLYTIPILWLGTSSVEKIPSIVFGMILLVTCTCGISLLTAALNVRFRDVNFFVQALLILWFYATPIIYSFSLIPYGYMWLWRLNPLTAIVQLFQYGFVGAPGPGIGMIGINTAISALALILGIVIFHKESKNFDDWV